MRGLSFRRGPSGERGAVAVIVAVMLLLFMVCVALAVDVGGLYLRRRELVNGSDAAALSAARTCARGGSDNRFGAPEAAADYQVQQNARITGFEVAGVNITSIGPCGEQWGHVSVRYTSEQSLFFAPAVGFEHTKPVTTNATASWGLGSNNAIPLVLSSQLVSTCPKPPPTGTNTIGQPPCGTWYDNDTLNNGNFGFLSLKPQGWNVPATDNCSQGNAGSNEIGDWVSGDVPMSVVLNWTDPTYVCNIGGFKGQSHPWNEMEALARVDAVRDFPITWDGPGSPCCGAPPQGFIGGTKIEKYDVIGFAALRIVDVFTRQQAEAQGTPAQDYTCDAKVRNNATIPGSPAGIFYSWSNLQSLTNGPCQVPSTTPDSVTSVTLGNPPLVSPGDYTYTTLGVTLYTTLPAQAPVKWVLHKNAIPGACGPPPTDNSAKCVVTQWLGSTLTGDYPTDHLDNVRVVRLCDLTQGTCLDQ